MSVHKKLTIVHILLSKGFAGTERSTAESCNSQCEQHNVTLICRKNSAKKPSGVSILEHLDKRVNVILVSPYIFPTLTIQRYLKHINADIVHAHLRRATRILSKCNISSAKISTLHIGVNSPHFMDMDALIAISPWQLDTVPPEYNGLVKWIRNSLTPHPQVTNKKIAELRKSMNVDEHTFLVGGIGRLSYSKGWDCLINAFIQANIQNSKLVLIGEGSERSSLEKMAPNNNIQFLGFKRNIKDYYSTFDVFVCPSREEPMGRVILEALDANTPVIASDIEGPKDILAEFPGTLVPVNDVTALCSALQDAYEKRAEHSKRAKPDLSSHYIVNTSKEMLDFYNQTIKQSKN